MQRPLKIAIVSPSFGKFGGIESFVFALAQTLRKSPEIAGVTIAFKRVGDFELGGLMKKTMEDFGGDSLLVDGWGAELRRVIREADLVHCQNPLADVAVFSALARKPLVQTIHNWRRRGFRSQVIGRALAYSLARRHWYNSDFVWDSWEPRGRKATSGKPPLLSDLPTGIVPPEQRRGFIFVSRWIPKKGLETLLDAYESANVDRARWPLTLVGDGPLRPGIEGRLRERPIGGVKIAGLVSTEERNDLIRHSRWMVTPPNTKEDLGLTPIEARHVGVPCIITRDGGLPEAGGKFALVCEPGDAIGLRSLLVRAAAMPPDEYARISVETHRELLGYLKPLTVYPQLFRDAIERP
jgi:glycosyltransferase involved in cell wall biosynthesis